MTTTDTLTREFDWDAREAVAAKVATLTKRAAKLGLTFEAELSSDITRTHVWKDDITNAERVTRFGTVTFTTGPIALPGWQLLGVLTPMPTEDGDVVLYPTAVPGADLPEEVREWEARCDHCHTIRRRSETFIIRHDDGTLKQVGRQCLRDFLGHDADALLSRYAFLRDALGLLGEEDLWGGDKARGEPVWTLDAILTVTSAVVRRLGWTSRKAADAYELQSGHFKTTTKAYVAEYLLGRTNDAATLRKECAIEPEDREAAVAARAYWTEQTGRSDYTLNCKLLTETGMVIPKALGLAVSMLPVAQELAQKQAAERSARAQSAHVGTVGKREVFEVEVIGQRFFEGDYGTRELVTLRTREGAILKWWTTSEHDLPKPNTGEFVRVKATVKSHGAFNGAQETTVTRLARVVAKA